MLKSVNPGSWSSRSKYTLFTAIFLIPLFLWFGFEEHRQMSSLTRIANFDLWKFNTERDQRNLGLSDQQCEAAFPKLYHEIERARDWHLAQGGIKSDQIALWSDEPDKAHSQVKALIFNGQLYIVGEKQGVPDRHRVLGGLSNLYRAMMAIPDPRVLPNIEFTMDANDKAQSHLSGHPTRPGRTVWTWARHVSDNVSFVMPDFDGWAFPDDTLGGYAPFRDRVAAIDKPFKEKIPKAVWRGTTGVAYKLRDSLVKAGEGKFWSDIKELNEESHVKMHEHCNWQYVVHTEGNSWSGRLRYLHNCNSAVIVHNPLEWIAHFYPVMVGEGAHQNYIPVRNDWSDLDDKMQYYLSHSEEAERIATEGVRTFRDRFLTPAAEACYWRKLIREYAKAQTWKPQLYKEITKKDGTRHLKRRGVSWERFVFRPPKQLDYLDRKIENWNEIDFED